MYSRIPMIVAISISLVSLTGAVGVSAQGSTSSRAELEEIIVTGTRASLTNALNGKREAKSIVDGITSEELGVFPDANVADSLQHITGVSISRASGGEGQLVNIRGLGPEFSIVTVNNRILATDQNGREFAFDVLPAEVISEAWVHKSVEASTLEGSIGGAINLVTAKPFDNPGQQMKFSAEGQYGDKSEQEGFKFTAVASNTFADDTMGFLFSALLSDTPVRTDSLSDLNYGTHNWSWDHNGNLTNPGDFWLDDSRSLIIPAVVAYRARVEDKKRTALSGVFQFMPSERVEVAIDALYTRLDAPAYGYTQSHYMNSTTGSWRDASFTGVPTEASVNGNVVTAVTMDNLVPELVSFTEHRVVDTYQAGVNAIFTVSDDLSLTGDLYISKSVRDAGGKDKFVVAKPTAASIPNTATYSVSRGELPSIVYNYDESLGINSMADLNDNSQFAPHWNEIAGEDIDDQVVGASLVGEWFVDVPAVESLAFGVVYNKRTKDRAKFDNMGFEGLFSESTYTFDMVNADVVSGFGVNDFLDGIGGDFPREFVGFDIDAYRDALTAFENNPAILNPVTGEPYEVGYSDTGDPQYNHTQSFEVEEESLSFYVQANLEGELGAVPWFGNVGLRHVTTDTASNGWDLPIISVDQFENDDWRWRVIYDDPIAVSYEQSYDKLLPSANFGFYLTDDVLLRFAYAEVMSRASINQLSTEVDNSNLQWQGATINNVGNPYLEPVEAEQADIGVEWYFSEGSALTAAVFWKDIRGLVQDWQEVYPDAENQDPDPRPTLMLEDWYAPWIDAGYDEVAINVFEPQNLDRAKALGYEYSLQHWFDNGFGVTANYTYIETDSYTSDFHEGVLAGVPDTTYSLYVYYNTDKLSLQIGASHTEEYITSHWSPLNIVDNPDTALDEGRVYKSTADPMTWMSASASYQATDNLQVYLELDNIRDENWKGYVGEGIINAYEEWGRKYHLGLRYKF